jgi:hypothetical protein
MVVERSPEEAVEVSGAVARFAAEFSRRCRERNYTEEYIARRCRTTALVVCAWRSGVSVPNHGEWWHLGRVSRDFLELDAFWRAATVELGGDSVVGDSTSPSDRRQSGPCAISGVPGLRAVDDVADPAPASTGRSPAVPAVAAPAVSPVVVAPFVSDERSIAVPDRFVVFRCRITRGRVLELPLPIDLSLADVERLCAFLRTQADPAETL